MADPLLDLKTALQLLREHADDYVTPDALRALVRRVSVTPMQPGQPAVTVLYSGAVEAGADGMDAWTLADLIHAGDRNIRIVDDTHLGQLLANDAFLKAVCAAFPDEQYSDVLDLRTRRNSPGNKFLFDGQEGLWAEASARFAGTTVGRVITLTPNCLDDRTFARIELPALLDQASVVDINGIPMSVLREVARGPSGVRGLLDVIAETSRTLLDGLHIQLDEEDCPVGVDLPRLLRTPSDPAHALPSPHQRHGRCLRPAPPRKAANALLQFSKRRVSIRWLRDALGVAYPPSAEDASDL